MGIVETVPIIMHKMDTDHAYDEKTYMSVRLVDINILYLIFVVAPSLGLRPLNRRET